MYSILLIAATYILGLFVVNINKPDMGNFDETFLLLQFNGFTFSFCRAPFPAVWYIKRKLVLSVKLRSNFTSDSPRVSRLILPFTFRVENTLMRRKVSKKRSSDVKTCLSSLVLWMKEGSHFLHFAQRTSAVW